MRANDNTHPLRSALGVIITSVLFVLDRLRLNKLDVWTEGEGVKPKKTKTKHPKELKHFQLRTVRPEQDPRGAEQRSEIRDATWTASWQKKRFYTPQLPPFWPLLVLQTECAWRETRRASMPKRIHTCGSHHLGDSIPFCCKAPWEKQKHKNKTETWHQLWGLMPRRGASGPPNSVWWSYLHSR